jgi:hypothetical protein
MASLGNVGHTFNGTGRENTAWQFFTLDKQPTSVDMAFTGVLASSIPFAYAVMIRNSVINWRTRADASGEFHFYDMDNSGSQTYAITTYTQDGATGEAWTATVVGSVVTITKQFSAQRAAATAFA